MIINDIISHESKKINLYALKEDGPVTYEAVRDNITY